MCKFYVCLVLGWVCKKDEEFNVYIVASWKMDNITTQIVI